MRDAARLILALGLVALMLLAAWAQFRQPTSWWWVLAVMAFAGVRDALLPPAPKPPVSVDVEFKTRGKGPVN